MKESEAKRVRDRSSHIHSPRFVTEEERREGEGLSIYEERRKNNQLVWGSKPGEVVGFEGKSVKVLCAVPLNRHLNEERAFVVENTDGTNTLIISDGSFFYSPVSIPAGSKKEKV